MNGVQHYVRADGKTAVPVTAIRPDEASAKSTAPEPDFDAIRSPKIGRQK